MGGKAMKIDGRCHCGAIAYEAEVDPETVAICHCTDCQALSGTAFRTIVPVAEGDFRLVAGEPKIYIKIGDSGAKRAQGFCANCGSAIYATGVGEGPKVYNLRLGTARQRGELPPKAHYWYRSAQPWLADLSALPKFEKH
jgi:hypothetical protein